MKNKDEIFDKLSFIYDVLSKSKCKIYLANAMTDEDEEDLNEITQALKELDEIEELVNIMESLYEAVCEEISQN